MRAMAESAHHSKCRDSSDMDRINCGVLRLEDASYPENLKAVLGKKAPATLYFLGNLSLLKNPGVGFCGSRNASEKGLETAKDCAEQVAKNGSVVISGYASGVDMMAHHIALESGGATIIVMPEGIEHFKIKQGLRDVWDWSRVLVLSQCKPHEVWKAYHAMNRNQVIIGLSRAMIVIEAQEKGGTIEAGKSALKLHMPLFVAEYSDMQRTPGNSTLLQLGAFSLKKNRSEGRARLTSLFDTVKTFSHEKSAAQHNQLVLI